LRGDPRTNSRTPLRRETRKLSIEITFAYRDWVREVSQVRKKCKGGGERGEGSCTPPPKGTLPAFGEESI